MKQYKKPMMKIVELEKVDVLTCSGCDFEGTHNIDETGEVGNENYPDGCYLDCRKHKSK